MAELQPMARDGRMSRLGSRYPNGGDEPNTRDVRWPKFVGTETERNAFPFKKDLFLSSFFSFFLFPKTGLSTLSNLSLD